jgi:hypothetical protein
MKFITTILALSLCLSAYAAAPITRVTIERADGTKETFPATQPSAPLGTTLPATQPSTAPATRPATQPVVVVPKKLPAVITTGQSINVANEFVVQAKNQTALLLKGGSATLTNVGVTQGCIFQSIAADSVSFVNVFNAGYPNNDVNQDSCYNVKVWTSPARSFTWNNVGLASYLASKGYPSDWIWIREAPNSEAAFRIKFVDAKIVGVNFLGQGAGKKPAVQVRHVENLCQFVGCTFKNTWIEVGQQQVNGVYDTSQHVKQIVFDRCVFTLWAPGNKLIIRKPGVSRIVYVDCVTPDNQKFNGIE